MSGIVSYMPLATADVSASALAVACVAVPEFMLCAVCWKDSCEGRWYVGPAPVFSNPGLVAIVPGPLWFSRVRVSGSKWTLSWFSVGSVFSWARSWYLGNKGKKTRVLKHCYKAVVHITRLGPGTRAIKGRRMRSEEPSPPYRLHNKKNKKCRLLFQRQG